MRIEFSTGAKKEIEKLLTHYPTKEAALLPTLHLAQKEFGYLSNEVMEYVAGLLGVSPVRVRDVVSFYDMFYPHPVGKYILRVCQTLSCSLMGAAMVVEHLENRLGVKAGETTPDRKFTLVKVECLASCGTGPAMMVNEKHYENLTEEKIDRILESLE